jgi:hypothetical protein
LLEAESPQLKSQLQLQHSAVSTRATEFSSLQTEDSTLKAQLAALDGESSRLKHHQPKDSQAARPLWLSRRPLL